MDLLDLPEAPLPETPQYFELLSPDDQSRYRELRDHLGSPDNRYCRNHRLDTLQQQFAAIKAYCIRYDEFDSARCLVCGLVWLSDCEIAINIRQLRIIIAKSKSSINGALTKMHYEPVHMRGENSGRLVEKLPQLKGKYLDLRQWSIRRRPPLPSNEKRPGPESPSNAKDDLFGGLPSDFGFGFGDEFSGSFYDGENPGEFKWRFWTMQGFLALGLVRYLGCQRMYAVALRLWRRKGAVTKSLRKWIRKFWPRWLKKGWETEKAEAKCEVDIEAGSAEPMLRAHAKSD
jgi:hypothetical protein